ncbi:centrosomal protein CCDC61-like isoform X1 [Myxocyprinus asiaticus]|uniref:centrosomal protein CCDC61-like isoform X1 n=1 Tax=Myxocyprinus asiaticus TaxID=70543 RepID=UPI002222839E|nr:centrosomal protein CCDC61-like isoform X1 [Myxocyprinus asiaticus]XP_051532886.1 centrosomal protein CCDC61-like isoform X1 [Myxocyprinus asiaticus]XP_051532887.1 centrosomal protein CCDC61-like isoform X1 [Myxocyprinus asiaticus]
MEVGTVVQDEMKFRGAEFAVKVELVEQLLMVEISDVVTADQWRGEFDPAYIEDLTRKTGNFKQFPVFCSMLESAVNKSSESVTLDLLTYSDLELLRNRKAGVVGRPRIQPQSPALSAKRYLILIYTVEFDRIHYPLPLPYLGKPDPAELQKEIRALRSELKSLVLRGDHKVSDQETRRLRAELALVRDEKEALAKALDHLQMVGASSTPGALGLREAVHSLGEQLLKERAKSQRSASKRGQEQRLLLEQLEELKASERALRIRVKNLTTELALLRRGRATPVMSGRSGLRSDGEVHLSLSRERSLTRVGVRARSGSRERMEDRSRRSEERVRRADSSGSRNCISRPSPSPTGSRVPRFDPTAFIQDRQRRQREAEMKNQRRIRRDMLASPSLMERGRSRSRKPVPQLMRGGSAGRGRSVSVESRSRCSSEGSVAEFEELAKPLNSRGRKLVCNGPAVTRRRHLNKKPMCITPAQRIRAPDTSIDTGADLSEIDARLQALQDYMRDLDTGH